MDGTTHPGPLGHTFDSMLEARAISHPDRVFLRFARLDLTFRDTWQRAQALATGLEQLGVRRGHMVPVLLPNSPEFAVTLFALARLGATACLLNTGFRGPSLAGALGRTGAATIVLHRTFAEHVAEVREALPHLHTVVNVGGDGSDVLPGVRHLPFDEVPAHSGTIAPPEPTAPHHTAADPLMVLFTSGTTGPSKGCVLSHRYALRQGELMARTLGFRDDDVLYCPFPLFHIDATALTVAPALVMGITAAIGERFSVSGFWPEVRRFGATVFDFMGATLSLLHKAPPRPDDADNLVRLAWGVPVPDDADEFERRFGLQLVELYGSTDAGLPIYHPVDVPRRKGSCGRVIPEYDVIVADPHGVPVADGEVGELLVRPNEPSLMSDGYHGMPEATLASRRDLWFHTGDLVRRDSEGWFYFVGRRAESIRRRGENISSFEVEEVVKSHASVADAAAYGVPSELTEDDVMVAVVLREGAVLTPAELAEFCARHMARHMVPRYVDFVDDLPRTPTSKVMKEVLKQRGVTPTAWDREAVQPRG